jgi:ribonuclease P protein subunit POP4
MDEKSLCRDELIGLTVKIVGCSDQRWIGKSGKILDETKNTFLIEICNQRKKIAKSIASFEFNIDGKKIIINGLKIMYRPEDRIKKIR